MLIVDRAFVLLIKVINYQLWLKNCLFKSIYNVKVYQQKKSSMYDNLFIKIKGLLCKARKAAI